LKNLIESELLPQSQKSVVAVES